MRKVEEQGGEEEEGEVKWELGLCRHCYFKRVYQTT